MPENLSASPGMRPVQQERSFAAIGSDRKKSPTRAPSIWLPRWIENPSASSSTRCSRRLPGSFDPRGRRDRPTKIADSFLWLVDPLDGTTNFAHSYPQFCVSIALQYENETLLGLVYDPIRNECFKAVRQRGATLNDKPIKVSTTNEVDQIVIGDGLPLRPSRLR